MNSQTQHAKLPHGYTLTGAVFIVALVIGLLGCPVYRDIPVAGDALLHKNLGLEVLSGEWISSETFGYVETPGYPFILAGIYGIFGATDIAVQFVQVLIYALAAVLILLLGKLVFGHVVGLLSAIWFITYYDFVSSSYQIMREIWIVFLVLLFLFFAARYAKYKAFVDLSLSSLAYGFLVMVDPRYFFFLVVLLVAVAMIEREWYLRARSALIVFAGVGIFLVPWMIRQSIVYDQLVLFSPRRDSQMWSFLGADSGADENDIAGIHMEKSDYLRDLHATGLPLSKQHDIDEQLTDKYIENMQRKIPQSALRIFLHRTFEYWRFARFSIGVRAGNDMRFEFPWSTAKNINNILHIGLLIPFFVVGVWLSASTRNQAQMLILFFVIYHMLFHVTVHYLYRYRYPVLPLLFLISWFGVYSVGSKVRLSYGERE